MSDSTDADGAKRDRVAFGVLAALGVLAAVAVYFATRPPPQMGASDAVFKTVDALYTAVRERDDKRLGECAARLRAERDAGQLPPEAAARLDAIIARARSGAWQSAAERLYDFMLGQKREGFVAPPPKAKPKRKT